MRMGLLRQVQKSLQLVVGLGALFGGGMAIYDPSGTSYGASTEMLKTGPFSDFLIPGLFLLIVLGGGHLLSYLLTKREHRFHVYFSGINGGILVTWIVIQCTMLQAVAAPHVLFFFIGAIEGLVALTMLLKLRLFPFNKSVSL